eukprot:3105240-Amphidinium_carterae.1
MDVCDWPEVARELRRCRLVKYIPETAVPVYELSSGRRTQARAGIFGVPMSSGERARLIIDRRKQNALEMSIRFCVLTGARREAWSAAETGKQWRLLTLPHATSLCDLLLGPHSTISTTLEDCSDYFQRLLLPEIRHGDSICRNDLRSSSAWLAD